MSRSYKIYKTRYNEYFKEHIKLFKAIDFIAELHSTSHQSLGHLIRYYCLYSSRTKGKAVKDGSLAMFKYKATPRKKPSQEPKKETISNEASRRCWVGLIQKVFEVEGIIVWPNSYGKMTELVKETYYIPK